jgi:hypothetical protein
MGASEKVQKLRLILGGLQEPQAREILCAPHLSCGVPKGVIVELLGPARTEWFLQFLKLHPEFRVFWCEREQSILPTAIHQRGIDLRRITFGLLGEDLKRPLRRVMQSQLYQVLLAPNVFSEINTFKALQLLTERTNSTLFLLGKKTPSLAWPISMQLEIGRGANQGEFKIDILKQKHGKL